MLKFVLYSLIIGSTTSAFAIDKAAPQDISHYQITKQTTITQIRNLPENTQIKTPSGRTITALQYKKIADAILKIRSQGKSTQVKPQFKFSHTTGAPKIMLKPGADLKEISTRPDSEVIQLPDGRTLTVGDLKKLSKVHEITKGKSLFSNPSKPKVSRAGKTIKVYSQEDFKKLESKPDSTVLETKSGKRMTLGELRAYAKANGLPVGARK